MNSSWKKYTAATILFSVFVVETSLPTTAIAQKAVIQPPPSINDASFIGPQDPNNKYNPESVKSDCSTKGVINFGLATLFKAVYAGAGGDKTSILGFKPPEIFPDINYDVTLDVGSCVSSLLETGARYAFAKFKKRLLDRLTDDTIAWINGETDGRPKFFNQPFSQVLLDAADAAAGDALLDLGLDGVCSPFRARINLELTARRPVQEAVRCTLSQVVDNFESFGQDFSQGGWLAYSESLKPQNNPWGATLIAREAAQKKYQQKASEKQIEILAGRGYSNVKKCLDWALYAEVGGGNKWRILPGEKADVKKFPYSSDPPLVSKSDVDSISRKTKLNITNLRWQCTEEVTTIPGDLIATANSTAFTKDYDYVVNSDDLTPYLEAIFDAAVNRLIKRGADGLMASFGEKDSLKSNNSTNRPATKLDSNNESDKNFTDNSKDYEQFANPQKALAVNLKTLIASSTLSLKIASSTLNIVLASSTQFKKDVDDLATCETSDKRFGPDGICSATKTAQNEANLIQAGIQNTKISLNNAQANIDTYSVLNENYSEPILTAAVNNMSGIYRALEDINAALLAQKKIIEEKTKTTDIKNQLMLCLPESQSYTCKP